MTDKKPKTQQRRAKPAPSVASETPPRTPEQTALIDRLRSRRRARPAPKVKSDAKGIAPANVDGVLWAAQVADAVGVEDHDLMLRLVSQTAHCVRGEDEAGSWNVALAGVASVAPRDGTEAMLASQMVATHNAAMMFLRRAGNAEILDHMTASGGLAVKLLRTYAAQVEALGRYRNGGKQQVVVQHQHVAVNANQAAVAFGCAPGGGGKVESNGQPHAEQITHAPIAPMRGTHPGIDALSVPCDAKR